MNHFHKFKQHLAIQTFLAVVLPGALGIATLYVTREILSYNIVVAGSITGIVFVSTATLSQYILFHTSIKPLEMIWSAVWHVSPEKSTGPPPNIETVKAGREFVSAILSQVYELASSQTLIGSDSKEALTQTMPKSGLVDIMPVPMFALDKDWNIIYVNEAACTYLEQDRKEILNKGLKNILDLSFKEEMGLETWLQTSSEKRATDTHTWEYVKLRKDGKTIKKFDLAASYSKNSSDGHEALLVLFDKSNSYQVQEQATSYVAIAVHELRTPLTMLRGYIELFEDELSSQLSPEHQEFMRKMNVAGQNLAAFVSNILNIARIDEDQFELTLHEADWNIVLHEIVQGLELRAQVKGKRIHLEVDENLPTVGIDKISMYEVMNNLVDNAIKYSGQSPDITIAAHLDKEGTITTTVQDKGAGMPQNVLSGLFTKFYRSHRSKTAVSGSGLGLYLVKAMITAHGGNVWVQSKEGEGSTFGFTLQPYSEVSDKNKPSAQNGIEHRAGGWIKNHSLYRG